MTEIVPATPEPVSSQPASVHGNHSSGLSVYQQELWGHPVGLWVLTLTEGWVGFSLYGMQSILALYLTDHLLKTDHSGHVWGLGALENIVSALYAPAGPQAMAAAITGLFLALIYATPLLGGFLADRVLGQTRTILLGAVLMTAGHFLLSFDWSFVLALGLLLPGIGMAGGLRAQVGALYALGDRRRSDAYQIYMMGLQIAVIVSPALCASLAQIAWHWGFLAAGLGMLIGLLVYLFGRRWLSTASGQDAGNVQGLDAVVPPRPALTAREKKTTFLLLALVPVMAVGAVPNSEIFDGYLLWGREHFQLRLFGYEMPVSDLISLDGFISTLCAILVLWFWKAYSRRRQDLPEITKVALGTLIAAFGPLMLALGAWLSPGPHDVSLLWGLAFHIINDIGFSMNFAIGMALFSRAAPTSLNTILVACFSLHLFLSNLLIGKLATLLGRMSDVSFWLLHSGAALLASIILGFCAVRFRDLLAPQGGAEVRPD
ncbi:peptide MFS transporter [Gluconobacter kanchanaburiensis]|uniref:MFS transporter n=1 Tax=Gluconobacter kanchanaburiensis NBRC 103587 TaxID=1307948 RepID=A0A511B8G8_9PROT|nr:peptide MFS transporter [Gluconobacter kanchanaburiensis]MBF0861218.1 MFS transporter [Gluconobacter kanchanaburiensis]GBR70880.1 di-/tripeptide transporter [Gluconobacter kanchanaburiensis NBRC 103587]GEK95962.1 MFS transporter [Gluconobacter kanchanaburiensis NBRC 103587]